MSRIVLAVIAMTILAAVPEDVFAQAKPKKPAEKEVTYPPALPDGKASVTEKSDDLLKPPASLKKDVLIAKAAPTVDYLFYPGQTYAGKPWSNWGDSLAVGGKYYASIGDHLAPAGNAFVYEYDPEKKTFRQLVDVRKVLQPAEGHYSPGKIHGRLDLGDDGALYFSTHRGSTSVTTDKYHYKGDWILRHDLKANKTEVVAHGPVGKHCIPNSVLDPKRLIFYGGTAPGLGPDDSEGIHFFAYDVQAKKVLYDGPNGPSRYMIFAKSSGKVYFTAGKDETGALMRYDPAKNEAPQKLDATIGIRAATQETADGMVYTISQGRKGAEAMLYAFNTKTEKVTELGAASVGGQAYVASLDVDPTGRYVYYIPGAHGGSEQDGSAVVQFDVKTKQRKVIAFLHPLFEKKYACTLKGTYSSAVDPAGDKLYITWNVSRGSRAWDCCGLTVIHIPESERAK